MYEHRMLCVTLCQGAALHYLDGRNGVKIFDVWTFFAKTPHRRHPDPSLFRRHKAADFGPSRFGRDPNAPARFRGRRIDLLARSLDVGPKTDPVMAVRSWLRSGRSTSPRLLARKSIVLIEPLRGMVISPEPEADVRDE